MSGLIEGCEEPYSQQAGCIISLALKTYLHISVLLLDGEKQLHSIL